MWLFTIHIFIIPTVNVEPLTSILKYMAFGSDPLKAVTIPTRRQVQTTGFHWLGNESNHKLLPYDWLRKMFFHWSYHNLQNLNNYHFLNWCLKSVYSSKVWSLSWFINPFLSGFPCFGLKWFLKWPLLAP